MRDFSDFDFIEDNNDINNNLNLEQKNEEETIQNNIEDSKNISEENNTEQLKQNEELDIKRKKKKHKVSSKIAVGLVGVILCGTSVGFGLGVGLNTSKEYIARNDTKSFQFSDSKVDSIPTNAVSLSNSASVSEIIKNVQNSVVNISTQTQETQLYNQLFGIEGSNSGSGVIYKEEGDIVYILTNNHVIEGANYVTVSITGDEQISAKFVGKDPQYDLAVISVLKSDLKEAGIEEINVADFADSDTLEVGEYVLAIGNALGQGKTVTQGIISAQNKDINIDGKKLNVIQTDAAINPGNSGGALVDSNGEVVGINTAKIASSTIEGTGYAIPSSTAKTVADNIISNGSNSRPVLGVEVATVTDRDRQMYNLGNIEGVFIYSVNRGGNAANAGLIPSDIIVGFNGEQIKNNEDLSSAISKVKINDEVKIDIIRNGNKAMKINVKLEEINQNF